MRYYKGRQLRSITIDETRDIDPILFEPIRPNGASKVRNYPVPSGKRKLFTKWNRFVRRIMRTASLGSGSNGFREGAVTDDSKR